MFVFISCPSFFPYPSILLLLWSSVIKAVHIFHPDGAPSLSSDEGGVSRVPRSNPGPLIRQQTAAHHQVSGFTDGHPGGRPESCSREPWAQPGIKRPVSQGPGIPHHQLACEGSHLVSHWQIIVITEMKPWLFFKSYEDVGLMRGMIGSNTIILYQIAFSHYPLYILYEPSLLASCE